jgi:alkaline phosphatase
VLAVLTINACSTIPVEPVDGDTPADVPRNVIFLLGDGMGFAQVKAYRMYADDESTTVTEPLPFDQHLVGAVATDAIAMTCDDWAADECVRDPYGMTDSASAATAYATGRDTLVGALSVTPDGDRMPTILQIAKRRGKSTGLIATSEIMHASPAAFAAHVIDRDEFAAITDQFFDNQWNGQPMVDVLLGGGLAYFRREDRDLVAEFAAAGYATVFDSAQLATADGPKLLGLFADEWLAPAWDRDQSTPSLTDMMRAALDILKEDPDGFFLLVEGSQIDWAGHDNDVVGVIGEMEEFNAAVAVALEFVARSGDTLMVITADHETSGMSLGRDDIDRWDPRPLRGMQATPWALTAGFLAAGESLSDFLAPKLPFALSEQERSMLDATPRDEGQVFASICALFDLRTLTGWSSPGHTTVDVPLYATGPGSDRVRGTLQNEELGQLLQDIFLP